jgi:imidazolonepropionase
MAATAIVNARLVTMHPADGSRSLIRRPTAAHLGIIERGHIVWESGRITAVAAGDPSALPADCNMIDAAGGTVTPGFVDCHTHACWAGDRSDEWAMKLAGRSYLDILAAGGGIMSTVRAVRSASQQELTALLTRRLAEMARYGTTTVEVKSGYGLNTESELKMLRAIDAARALTPQRIAATFLGAHALDADQPDFVARTIEETLPAAARLMPGIAADAYCEQGAWSTADCAAYFERARALGCPVRVHTNQFHSLGMVERAVALGAVSLDHLEACSPAEIAAVAGSGSVAVGLPATSFCLGTPYLRARDLIDAGAALALATNANPGSAPVRSMPLVIALAVRHLHLTPPESLVATIWNAACVLGVQGECGSLAAGKSADVVLWPFRDERSLAYEVCGSLPEAVFARGVRASASHR